MANVKGSNVLTAVKMLRAHRERAARLLRRDLHHYLDKRILVSSWYPEADQLELLRAVSYMLPGSPDPWMVMGQLAARRDLASMYRHVVRAGNIKDTLRAATTLWQSFHDTGELTIAVEGPGHALATVRGYGAASREMCRLIGGYVSEVVAYAGARDVKAHQLDCDLDGSVRCAWRIEWTV
jgi:hypothetical protein